MYSRVSQLQAKRQSEYTESSRKNGDRPLNRARNRWLQTFATRLVSASILSRTHSSSHRPSGRYSSRVRRFRRTTFCLTNCRWGIHAPFIALIRQPGHISPSYHLPHPLPPDKGCADALIPNRISWFESVPRRRRFVCESRDFVFRRIDKGRALLAAVSLLFLPFPSAFSTSARCA